MSNFRCKMEGSWDKQQEKELNLSCKCHFIKTIKPIQTNDPILRLMQLLGRVPVCQSRRAASDNHCKKGHLKL